MKIQLELVINKEPDGRKFLNYWDFLYGKDVCCEIIGDELFIMIYDEDGNFNERKISFSEFIELVNNR